MMETLARFLRQFRWAPADIAQAPEREAAPRPTTSFLATLSDDQVARLRAYRGVESQGDDAFRRPAKS